LAANVQERPPLFLNGKHPDLDADQDGLPRSALSLQPDCLEGLIDD
jgi:hypothetical protein